MKNQLILLFAMGGVFVLSFSASPVMGTAFTLSDAALMSLDWAPPGRGEVIAQRDVPGLGVEFDFFFPGNQFPENGCYYKSTNEGGSGTLSGIDVSMYDSYDLKFTLVSANGVDEPSIEKELIVGAYIGKPGRYKPEWLDFGQPTISSTLLGRLGGNPESDLNLHEIDFVGLNVRLYGTRWSPSGNNVTILIEAAPGAVAIVPEPATLLLLGLGAVMIRPKR